MATTLKKAISPDSLQCKEQCSAIKSQFLQNLPKSTAFITHYCRPFFWTALHLLTLGVTVPNTINTHKFCLKHHIWLEIQNSITIFHGYLWLFKICVNLNFFFNTLSCCIALPTVSFKNSLTNNCCFGTSTKSPWAKVTFLYMYFFQYTNH